MKRANLLVFDTEICTFLVEAHGVTGHALVEQVVVRIRVMKSSKALEHVLVAVPIILFLVGETRVDISVEYSWECVVDITLPLLRTYCTPL